MMRVREQITPRMSLELYNRAVQETRSTSKGGKEMKKKNSLNTYNTQYAAVASCTVDLLGTVAVAQLHLHVYGSVHEPIKEQCECANVEPTKKKTCRKGEGTWRL